MKLRIALTFGFLCLIAACSAKPADAEYEYDDAAEPAPPPKPTPRSNPLIGRRNPLSRNAAAKTPSSTTPPPPPPKEEEEIVEEEIPEEELGDSTTTTENSRKLKAGVVRPFRSNEDLLATLKRRREQAIINKSNAKANAQESQESSQAAAEPEKPSSKARPSTAGRRNRYNKSEPAPVQEVQQEVTPAPARTGRRFRN